MELNQQVQNLKHSEHPAGSAGVSQQPPWRPIGAVTCFSEEIVVFFLVQIMDLKLTVDGLEKERDFYFGKLRDIELICQENENNPVLSKIIDILYATEVQLQILPSIEAE